MSPHQLQSAVARATGEDRRVIARRGFSLVDDDPVLDEDDLLSLFIDWDQLEAERTSRRPSPACAATSPDPFF